MQFEENYRTIVEPQAIDPRTKIVIVLTQLTILFSSKSVWYHFYLLILSLTLIFLIKYSFKMMIKIMFAFFLFSIFGFIFVYQKQNLLFLIEQWFIIFNRFTSSFFIMTWFFQSTPTNELSIIMNKFYFPSSLSTFFTGLYQLIPLFSNELSVINSTRKIKGFVASKWNLVQQFSFLKKILKTIFSRTINNAIFYAEALLIKGYNPLRKRKFSISRKFRIKDILISLIALFICVLSFFFY